MIGAVVVTAPLFVLEMALAPEPVADWAPPGYLTVDWYDDLGALWTVAELRTSVAILLGVVCLVLRYRRGDETRRRQLLWLVLAAIVVIAIIIPWSFLSGTPIAVLFAIPLIPVAVTVGIVRAQLLDIRLVVSRVVAWVLLSLAALLGYVVLVAVLDTFVSARLGKSALVTVLVALALAPLLPRLQRQVDRWMYGDRRDPARVATRVSEQLAARDRDGDLTGVAAALTEALRLPYVAVATGSGVIAESGARPTVTAALPLSYGGADVGELVVGLRAGERRLAAADRATLDVLAASLAVAVRAIELTADLERSRERLVVAREEERRRLRPRPPRRPRSDAHRRRPVRRCRREPDRLRSRRGARPADGPPPRHPDRARRRTPVVDDLRPPSLDELGLVGALQQRADRLALRADGRRDRRSARGTRRAAGAAGRCRGRGLPDRHRGADQRRPARRRHRRDRRGPLRRRPWRSR